MLQALSAVLSPQARMRTANAIGSCVCAIAALHYFAMHHSGRDDVWAFRYSDWYPTTALLLLEIFWLVHPEESSLPWGYVTGALLFCAAMLLAGQLSRAGVRGAFGIGCVLGAVSLAMVVLGTHDCGPRNLWAFGFLSLWCLYPVAVLMRHTTSELALTVLDVLTKGVFGVVVALVSLPH